MVQSMLPALRDMTIERAYYFYVTLNLLIISEIRSHHNYINSDDFISFIESIKHLNTDIDIMIEAKAKDEAVFKLVRELKFKTNYKFIDETTFEV